MERSNLINVLVLTSSRADFGIYLPLLEKLKGDPRFLLKMLAFGTHLSKSHGYTLNQIEEAGFESEYQISSMLANDASGDIATSYALTALKFADFWKSTAGRFDWVIVLGDRFEMAAAVAAGIPFNMPFVHIHGGETTLGAIDNIYRHFITLTSKMHFVALPQFQERVNQILGDATGQCFIVGALSLDNTKSVKLLSKAEFKQKWAIDLDRPSILITVHPETVAYERNQDFALKIYNAFKILSLDMQLIVTMPNADTAGFIFRDIFKKLKEGYPEQIHLVENFGTQSYFTCMKYAGLMIGNTSSGIIEAASFEKYVLNLGNRQKGRIAGENVIHLPFETNAIIDQANFYFNKKYEGANIYDKGGAAEIIIQKLVEHAGIQ